MTKTLPIVERLRGVFPYKTLDYGIEVDDSETAEKWMKEAANLIEALHGALAIAQKELAELMEFHDCRDKPCGDYDRECPISMGEWFDKKTRERVAKIDAALKQAEADDG
jgi:hypothetical protein